MSKTNRRPSAERSGYRRRNKCDGKLVAYILEEKRLRDGGAYRDRTDDLMLAKQPLSQLS
jgi:hypothetical protein